MFYLFNNRASSISTRVNPDINSSPFREGSSSDYSLEPISNLGNEGKKKFISRYSYYRHSKSGLFQLSRVEINLVSSYSSLKAILIIEAS
jgi:hypothetical protein